MWDPTKEHNESTVCWHVITSYRYFVLHKGLMMDWFKPKHLASASEREYKLCFDWWFIPFSLLFSVSAKCIMFYACIFYRAHWIARRQYLSGDTDKFCTFDNISQDPTIVVVHSKCVLHFCLTDGQTVCADVIQKRKRPFNSTVWVHPSIIYDLTDFESQLLD